MRHIITIALINSLLKEYSFIQIYEFVACLTFRSPTIRKTILYKTIRYEGVVGVRARRRARGVRGRASGGCSGGMSVKRFVVIILNNFIFG